MVLVIFLIGEFGSERLVQQVVDQILAATARKSMEQVTHSTPQVTMGGAQATPTTTPTVQQQGKDMAVCKVIDNGKIPHLLFNGPGNEAMQAQTYSNTYTHTHTHTHVRTHLHTDSDSSYVPASKFIITGQKTKTLHKEELTMSETERKIARQVEEKARLQQQKRKTAATTTQERKREAPGSRSPVSTV